MYILAKRILFSYVVTMQNNFCIWIKYAATTITLLLNMATQDSAFYILKCFTLIDTTSNKIIISKIFSLKSFHISGKSSSVVYFN